MLKRFCGWGVVSTLIAGPYLAHATAIDTYGISARSMALGNAALGGDNDAYQAFFNPASLTDAKKPTISVDYVFTDLKLNDLEDLRGPSPSGLPEDPFDEGDAGDLRGTSLGINLPLFQNVHGGLAGYMPNNNFGRLWGGSRNDVHYLRYSERQQRPAIYTALAARLPAGFAIGGGLYYTLRAEGILQMALAQTESAARFQLEMQPVFIPYGGIQWRQQWADQTFKLGAVYRAEQDEVSSIDTDLALNFDDASLPFSLETTLAPFYDPEIFRLGAAWETPRLGVYAAAEFARWSKYNPPSIGLTGDDIGMVSSPANAPQLELNDTWAYRTGVEWRQDLTTLTAGLWRLGLEHHTAATDGGQQRGVIDLERNVVALGFGLKLLPGVLDENREARFEIAYQRTLLTERSYLTATDSARRVNAGGTMHTLIGGFHYEL
jgi:hypothetical protein